MPLSSFPNLIMDHVEVPKEAMSNRAKGHADQIHKHSSVSIVFSPTHNDIYCKLWKKYHSYKK